jgi:hypothetical protein
MTSLEVSAEPSTNVHPRAEAESGVTAVDPRCPVLVARLWPPQESVFDSEINPLSKSASQCLCSLPGSSLRQSIGSGELVNVRERWQLRLEVRLGTTDTVRCVTDRHIARIEVQGRPATFATTSEAACRVADSGAASSQRQDALGQVVEVAQG